MQNDLTHSGILGQKWHVKNGPPYPLRNSQRSAEEQRRNKKSKSAPDEVKETPIKDRSDDDLRSETSRLQTETNLINARNSKIKAENEFRNLTTKGKSATQKALEDGLNKGLSTLLSTTITKVGNKAVDQIIKSAEKKK